MTRQSTSKSWAATRPTAVSTRLPSIRGSSTRPRARWVPYRPSTTLCVRTSAPAALWTWATISGSGRRRGRSWASMTFRLWLWRGI
jgi:hypothetical protein